MLSSKLAAPYYVFSLVYHETMVGALLRTLKDSSKRRMSRRVGKPRTAKAASCFGTLRQIFIHHYLLYVFIFVRFLILFLYILIEYFQVYHVQYHIKTHEALDIFNRILLCTS